MKLHSTLLAACASLALAATGCLVGEVDSTGNGNNAGNNGNNGNNSGNNDGTNPGNGPGVTPNETPEQAFQAVFPAVNASCGAAGVGCHATTATPIFVGTDAADTYTKTKANKPSLYPNNAATDTIVTYGTGTGHSGGAPIYQPEHLQAVEAWLAAEAASPIDDQPSPLSVWSGCMDLAEFEQTGMADAWADKNAQGQGDCDACHNLGADGFLASNVDTRVFKYISESPKFMISYFTLNETGTEVIINRARLEKVGTQQAPHQLHGAFNVDGDAYQRLQNFYNLTKARLDAGTCGPPRF